MNKRGDITVVGLLLRALAVGPFAFFAVGLTFALLYISAGSDWEPMWSQMGPQDYAIPVTMTALAAVFLALAVVAPRLAVRVMRRRIDAARNLEVYQAILLLMTAMLALGVLIPGFVTAFMFEDLVFWAVIVVAAVLSVALAWHSIRRREKWAPAKGDGA